MIESRRHCFPIDSLEALCQYVRFEAEQVTPCLALASIVLGFFETTLTIKKHKTCHEESSATPPPPEKPSSSLDNHSYSSEGQTTASESSLQNSGTATTKFPILEFQIVKTLFEKFLATFQEDDEIHPRKPEESYISRETIKLIVDTVWNALSQKFTRDKPHIQSLYSFTTGEQLDAFGVSFAVVAACQQLGYDDVRLCLSEDHSWVVFGPEDAPETAEVTWHGKSGEERRGFPLSDLLSKSCWVYLDGNGVLCKDRKMELSSAVNAMNPIIEAGMDSLELVTVQQKLLHYFREKNIIDNYPLAISNLANSLELLDISDNVSETFQAAILASRNLFNNRHVYPYTYYGGFLLRNSCLRAAIWCWAEASNVLSSYCYTRDDEEVYKEMYEFAVDLLPALMKANSEEIGELISDPLSFALLLKFYDGLCLWEDGSQIQVLHITWGRAIVACLSKFPVKVRTSVKLLDRSTKVASEDESKTSAKNDLLSRNNVSQLEKKAFKFLAEISSFAQFFTKPNEIGVLLESAKMDAIKELLSADRLRPDAIQLQITAQTAQRRQRDSLPESSSSNTSATSEPRTSKRRRFVTSQQ